MKLSTSSIAPALRAAFHRTADATQMIRKIDRKNSTETFSTDHGSMWRTMRRTLRARTFGPARRPWAPRDRGRRAAAGARAARLGVTRRLRGALAASAGSTPGPEPWPCRRSRWARAAPGWSRDIEASVGQALPGD